MMDFTFLSPTKLIVGKGVEKETGRWIRAFGGSKVLVQHDSGYVKQCGLVDQVIDCMKTEGLEVIELGGVVPNPHLSLVYEGIDICRKENVDFILAIGGGSVIDSAKGIAMGVPYEGDVWDFYEEKDGAPVSVADKVLPVGVVLTIAATGSECSWSSILTKEEENLKRFCDNDILRPVFAIENPELTYTLPWYQTASGIVDIMSHSMERYFGPAGGGNILTDFLCESIFKTCMECARVLKDDPQDYDARGSVMVASTLSHNGLTGMGRAQDWACHMIEHELSGEFNVTHGAGLAVIIPAWMRYVYKDNMELFLKWATRVMNVTYDFAKPERTILEAIDALENFYKSIGMPVRMSEMKEIGQDVTEEIMYKMARRVRAGADGTIGGLKVLNTEDIVNIFKLAN